MKIITIQTPCSAYDLMLAVAKSYEIIGDNVRLVHVDGTDTDLYQPGNVKLYFEEENEITT